MGVIKGTDGYWLKVLATTANLALPTTASTYAVGCECTNSADGTKWVNVGTVAVPYWESEVMSKVITLSAAEINTLYSVGKEIIPAYPGKIIVVDNLTLDLTGTATQFTSGGVVNAQYDVTVHGAGTKVHADIAAAVLTGATARIITNRIPLVLSSIATASITSLPLWIGAQTQDFATGTGTAVVKVKYHLV